MVQVIPRVTKQGESRLKIILPWFSLILVILVIGAVFFYSSGIKTANNRIIELDEELSQGRTQEQKETESNLISYKKKVSNVIDILKEREKSLDFYSFLEELVHPKIYYTRLDLDMENGLAELKGFTEDFKSLGEQVLAFKQSGYIYDAQAETVSLEKEDGIEFTMKIVIFEPKKEK